MKLGATIFAFLAGPGIVASSPENNPKLTCVSYDADLTSEGCYVDSGSPRTLTGTGGNFDANTPQACGDYCGRLGYKYAGVEYSRECYCGNDIGNVKADEEKCSAKCSGDSTLTCGGTYFIGIYKVNNPLTDAAVAPECTAEPMCSNDVCNTTLSPKQRAAALISLWTVEEKIANLVEGAAGVPRLGIKKYGWWTEGLHGLADTGVTYNAAGSGSWDCATSFPQPIIVGAAFDDGLVTAMGDVISTETRAYSGNGRTGLDLYTPNINSFKDPRWGRGQETPGEDPFHLQSYVKALLAGLERKVGGYKRVIATCKHYAGNDFEGYGSISRHNFDAQISYQDLNEFYLAPFRVCAERDAGAFMCSYNSVNGAPACANTYLMEDILRKHWGWEKDEHYISTDCGAVDDIWENHKYVATKGEAAAVALKAGADLECSFSQTDALQAGYDNKTLTEEDMDKALTRMWAGLISLGYFDPANAQVLRQLTFDDVNTPESQNLTYIAAVEGSVLIKNTDNNLPLRKENKVAIIGPWSSAQTQMQGNYHGPAPYLISPVQSAKDFGLDFTWANGSGISSDDATLDDALAKAKAADLVIYMGGIDNTIEAESRDRTTITWPEAQLKVIRQLADLGKPVTVVQFGGGQLDDTELLNNTAIKSILWGGYPGQSGGKAIIDLLYGVAAPAGRLPVTQYPAPYIDEVPPTDMTLRPSSTNPGRTHIWYSKDPVVPFGHGLHYTSFKVAFAGDFKWQTGFVAGNIASVGSLLKRTPWMELINKPVIKVPITVQNVGRVKSDYVVLLFLKTSNAGPAPRPNKILVGYTRVKDIQPGKTKSAEITLSLERFLRVDTDGNRVLYPGKYDLFIDIDAKATKSLQWTGKQQVVETFPH